MPSATPYASIAAIGDGIGPVIADHIERAFRRLMSGPGVTHDPRFVRLVTGTGHPLGNFACMRDPADEAGVQAAIDPLIRANVPAAVLFAGAVTDPIAQQLADAGFTRAGGLPAMAIDIDQKLAQTDLAAGYTFARVMTIMERNAWAEIFTQGYGLPSPVGAAFTHGTEFDVSATAPVQYFLILTNGKPVGTSLLYLENGVAGIYCVTTLPEERKKGLGAYATAQPLRLAQRVGYRVGVLQASEEGYPIYQRLGFADFGAVPLFLRMPQ